MPFGHMPNKGQAASPHPASQIIETHFIVNPRAGKGRAVKELDQARVLLRELFPEHRVLETKGPGHAATLAADSLQAGCSRIVAVGGDGTLNEIVNGLLQAGQAWPPSFGLGVVAAGTGMDFVRTLGLPSHIPRGLEVLPRCRPKAIDVGEVSFLDFEGRPVRRFFLNVASLGISAGIAHRANERGKPLQGRFAFVSHAVRALLTWRNQRIQYQFDQEEMQEGLMKVIAVANGKFFGGGMCIGPNAEIDDGWLQSLTVGDMGAWTALWNFPKLFGKREISHPLANYGRCRRLHVRSEETVYLELDGEQPGTLPATIEIRPAALPFLIPEDAKTSTQPA
ncbi:MAG: diacylglycerol kinase family lipid kinase [Planctomycetota bacterium]|nr:MAG: diacylglycerol kinase family lipid kinase [Planctomycetota bacterium]